MSYFIKSGITKTCRRCGRKGSVLVAERSEMLLVWDRTEFRDVDLDPQVTFERLIDPDYGDGYCK